MEICVNPFRRGVFRSEDGDYYCYAVREDFIAKIAIIYAPSAEESRRTLLDMRQSLGMTRSYMSALLGVPIITLRRWETGERKLSAPARKLIWLVDCIFFHPKLLQYSNRIATWGRYGGKFLTDMEFKRHYPYKAT